MPEILVEKFSKILEINGIDHKVKGDNVIIPSRRKNPQLEKTLHNILTQFRHNNNLSERSRLTRRFFAYHVLLSAGSFIAASKRALEAKRRRK